MNGQEARTQDGAGCLGPLGRHRLGGVDLCVEWATRRRRGRVSHSRAPCVEGGGGEWGWGGRRTARAGAGRRFGRALFIAPRARSFVGLLSSPARWSRCSPGALAKGMEAYFKALHYPDTISSDSSPSARRRSIAVPLNLVFGMAAAWCLSQSSISLGKSLLIALIDLPFAVSPVISGRVYVLVFGVQGWSRARASVGHGVKIIFAVPGIVLATTFVTLPFVARELILAVMQTQGKDEEYAALDPGGERLADLLARHAAEYQAGAFSTASSSATPGRWASLVRSPSSPATSRGGDQHDAAAHPTATTSIVSWPPSRSRLSRVLSSPWW